jgi:hypothetical protein
MLNWAGRSDWGNRLQRTFAEHVLSWPTRFLVETASGYFKAALRRDPNAACWAWALEWNSNYRVVGFCGDATAIETHSAQFPALENSLIGRSPDGGELRARLEPPLAAEDDRLFTILETR